MGVCDKEADVRSCHGVDGAHRVVWMCVEVSMNRRVLRRAKTCHSVLDKHGVRVIVTLPGCKRIISPDCLLLLLGLLDTCRSPVADELIRPTEGKLTAFPGAFLGLVALTAFMLLLKAEIGFFPASFSAEAVRETGALFWLAGDRVGLALT